MCVFTVWRVVCVLGFVGTSVCMNEDDFEVNYMENYDNEISEQEMGDPPVTPCQEVELTRWDKLFIALEDSHMRQNMLSESLDQCCGGMASLKAQVEKLGADGGCQKCVPSLEAACKGHAEQASLRLQRGLAELGEEGAERARKMNATLHHILHSSHEQNARLKRLEEAAFQRGEATGRDAPTRAGQTVARPGTLAEVLELGQRPFPSGLLEQQEVAAPTDMEKMERALVTIATELQKVQVQLAKLMEHRAQEGGHNRVRRTVAGRIERRDGGMER